MVVVAAYTLVKVHACAMTTMMNAHASGETMVRTCAMTTVRGPGLVVAALAS